ncbi:glyoxalase [Nocardioides immobilis]|uniref:Glyoxalase n=1 Tax=Nocardioides immobilis TaxID=2049295 RepID=A0A417Y4A2_9ACTN|nr:glyoxalase [Nocardioides immobilis]RHW27508.1 glyoxalase [Nocardioides immobilis]
MGVTIDELLVADPPEAWQAAGFVVGPDAVCRVGTVGIRLVGRDRGTGIVGWTLRDLAPGMIAGELDGIPTTASDRSSSAPPSHPNGVVSVDHVVLLSPDLRRTVGALEAIDLHPRRERDGDLGGVPMRQVFFRLGEVILEVVGSPDQATEGPATLWGVTHVVADIDATADLLGEHVGRVKDAVQPGRRIATLRHRELGMSVNTAVISPHV